MRANNEKNGVLFGLELQPEPGGSCKSQAEKKKENEWEGGEIEKYRPLKWAIGVIVPEYVHSSWDGLTSTIYSKMMSARMRKPLISLRTGCSTIWVFIS